MKKSITAEKDGTVKIGTVNREEAASLRVEKLKGKKLASSKGPEWSEE